MLPVERMERIKEILESEKNIKITDLSSTLGVSEMTIHRDLKPLIEDGYVFKTFGGVSLANPVEMNQQVNSGCVYCHRPVKEKLAYKLILQDQRIETACCAHCGLLRQQQLGDQVAQAMCYDFLCQTTISVPLAYYVMDTSLNIGCCQPQVLSFEWRDHAESFIKGFGGAIYTFNDITKVLHDKMTDSNGTCHT